MKKLLFYVLITLSFLGGYFMAGTQVVVAHRSIPELYTDKIETLGNVKRIYFHFLVELDNGAREWHYYGTTAAEKPPTTADPVSEHPYIQFPNDLDLLGPDGDDALYQLGLQIAVKQAGL